MRSSVHGECFAGKGDIINNQLGLRATRGSSAGLQGHAEDCGINYPFAPYQFQLLQKVFESIRKVGATGKHLSRASVRMLDAFQSAAVGNADREHRRASSPCTTSTRRLRASWTVVQAHHRPGPAQPGAGALRLQLLRKALFLIRYCRTSSRPTSTTSPRCALTRWMPTSWPSSAEPESLARLEQQTPGQPQWRLWFFPDQRRARRRARDQDHVTFSPAAKCAPAAELIFDEILRRPNQGAPPRHQGRLRIQPPARRRRPGARPTRTLSCRGAHAAGR